MINRQRHSEMIAAGDISPRVVLHDQFNSGKDRPHSEWLYTAWTPTWEGPPRPDYPAALADLNDKLRK